MFVDEWLSVHQPISDPVQMTCPWSRSSQVSAPGLWAHQWHPRPPSPPIPWLPRPPLPLSSRPLIPWSLRPQTPSLPGPAHSKTRWSRRPFESPGPPRPPVPSHPHPPMRPPLSSLGPGQALPGPPPRTKALLAGRQLEEDKTRSFGED